MSNHLRLCLDLNIWCAALLADIKENQNMATPRKLSGCQSIVDTVRYGRCYMGKVELVISWGMLNRLEEVLLRLTPLAEDASFYVDIIRSYAQIQPQLILGGTGVIPIDDIEDQHVLEAALAGRANVLVTANFKDFLNKDIELIIPERHSIYNSPIHEFHIVHPYLMINWLNQGNIPKIL
jgi:predicted nucleic acid-binding protein